MKLTQKEGQLIVILPIMLLLLLQAVSIFSLKVYSISPTVGNGGTGGYIYNSETIEFCVGQVLIQSPFQGCTTSLQGINTKIGDLLTYTITCSTSSAGGGLYVIFAMGDGAGDVFINSGGTVNSLSNTVKNQTVYYDSQTAYALAAVASNTGYFNTDIEATTGSHVTLLGCVLYIEDDSIHVSQFQFNGGGQYNPLASQQPKYSINETTIICGANYHLTCVPNEFFVGFYIGGYNNTGSASPPHMTSYYPLTTTYPVVWYPREGLSLFTAQSFLSLPNQNVTLKVNVACKDTFLQAGCNSLDYSHAPTYWANGWTILGFSVGQQSSNCYNIFTTLTHTKLSSGSTVIQPNVTYANWFWFTNPGAVPNNPSQSIWLTQIQLDIKSVSQATTVTLALYETTQTSFQNAYNTYQNGIGTISNVQAIPMTWGIWKLTTNASPQNLTLHSQFAVNSGAVGLFVITSTKSGVTVYNSTAPLLPTITDNVDQINQNTQNPTPLTLPNTINSINFNQKNIALWANYVIQCNATIYQTPPVQKFTSPHGVNIGPINCTTGGFNLDILNGLLKYWPIWIIPMITSGLFGMIGMFMGLIMGMGIGTATGIVPVYADILIFLGVGLIMVRREI